MKTDMIKKELMENFDFKKISKIEMLFSTSPMSERKLRELASELIDELLSSKNMSYISNSKLRVFYEPDGDITLVKLEYVFESSLAVLNDN